MSTPATVASANPGIRASRRARARALQRPRKRTLAAGSERANAAWTGPDAAFSLADKAQPATRSVVESRFPELLDLVDAGNLVYHQRASDYRERRSDGYMEPQEIFILGTAHVSSQSASDVARLIAATQPDAVVVELCRSRSAALYVDQLPEADARKARGRMLLSGEGGFLGAFQRSATLGGIQGLLGQVVGKAVQDKMSPPGMHSGLDMVAARKAAEEVGAQIVLGDRPIEITMDRCWQALSWRARLQLLGAVGGIMLLPRAALVPADRAAFEAEVEELKRRAGFEQELVSNGLPELYAPLVHERDLYLAWSMKRSKAVNGAGRAVGVVGKGHLRGVAYAMQNDPHGAIRFSDLVGGRNRKGARDAQWRGLATTLVRDTVVFGAAYLLWTWWAPGWPW